MSNISLSPIFCCHDLPTSAIGKNRHLGLYGSIWCLPGRKNYLQGSPGADFIKDGYDLKLFAVTFLGWAGDENFWIEKEERSKIKPGGVTDKESSPTARGQRTSKRKYDDKSPASVRLLIFAPLPKCLSIHPRLTLLAPIFSPLHSKNVVIKFKRWQSSALRQLGTPRCTLIAQ